MTAATSTKNITVDREVIATLVDWIKTGLDLDYWREHGAHDSACNPDLLETFELSQQVDQILDTRSWEGS